MQNTFWRAKIPKSETGLRGNLARGQGQVLTVRKHSEMVMLSTALVPFTFRALYKIN